MSMSLNQAGNYLDKFDNKFKQNKENIEKKTSRCQKIITYKCCISCPNKIKINYNKSIFNCKECSLGFLLYYKNIYNDLNGIISTFKRRKLSDTKIISKLCYVLQKALSIKHKSDYKKKIYKLMIDYILHLISSKKVIDIFTKNKLNLDITTYNYIICMIYSYNQSRSNYKPYELNWWNLSKNIPVELFKLSYLFILYSINDTGQLIKIIQRIEELNLKFVLIKERISPILKYYFISSNYDKFVNLYDKYKHFDFNDLEIEMMIFISLFKV